MQGKGVIKFFAIVLTIVCIYQLSFTWVARNVENKATAYAKGDTAKYKGYLDSVSLLPGAYPILGHSYQYCLERELALGLDLKGGMNVTMQISLVELVKTLSNNNPDVAFNQALAKANADISQTDYITKFVNEYEKLAPNGKLAAIFATKDNQAHLKFNASNSDVEKYLKEEADVAVKQSYTVLNTRIDQFGVTQPNIQLEANTNRILIELPGVKDPERVRKLLSGSAKLEFFKTYDNSAVYPMLTSIDNFLAAKLKSTAKDSAKTTAAGVKKDTTAAKGGLALLNKVEKSATKDTSLAGAKSKLNETNPLFSVLVPSVYRDQATNQPQLAPGAIVGMANQKDTAKVNAYLNAADVKARLPRDIKFLWSVKPAEAGKKIFQLYAIKLSGAENGPVLGGDVINDAQNDIDPQGKPEVRMEMNSQGAEKWRAVTAEAAQGKQEIAIVLDDNVYSAPAVQNEISGGVSTISGSFTTEDTKDLANVLKAGRLEAPAHIVGEDVVGPSLGQQSINAGLLSCLIGLLVVLVFMVAYYNRAGTVAVVAVIINVFFLMGVLTSLRAVLTLPGVAGIVLLFGMSVDANVLIYERVREELALGKSVRLAVSDGFKHALSSILDSNISTFLTGVILFVFGTGPIQGFATTLMIGIITSLFCSLLISRLIFEWMIEKGWDIKFSNPWSSHTFKNANFAFVKKRFRFYIFSGTFIVAGIISMFVQGFNYGVDFKGGRTYLISFQNKNVTDEDVRAAIKGDLGTGAIVKTSGSNISITTDYLIEDNSATADDNVRNTLLTALNKKAVTQVSQKDIQSSEKVQATIADGLRKSAIWTVIFAIVIISTYIFLRFRKWQFSLAAMVATAHDALMVLSFFSLFKNVPFLNLDIDQSFIAAILTVIGYSINDTVVVFDRIREFLSVHHAKTDEPKEVINNAINNTLSRTIITALTVLFVLIVLFVFGGDVLRGFSFALLIGVCFGTYSSICIATPVIIDFGKKDLR